MQKNDLIALVNKIHRELIENINKDENPSKRQVVTFLQDATNAVASLKENSLNDLEKSKMMFTDAFKEITQLHEEVLISDLDSHINISEITQKFSNFQKQIFTEVEKANSIITDLTTQIHKLERSSNIDSLTKVFNRRSLTSYLERLCQTRHLPYELHLLILDIDDFKVINDTFGHLAGDKVLIFIANILKSTLRDCDKVFRYSGEEFVITLNRISPETCLEVANRILTLIRSSKLIYKGDTLNVTMSIGATQYSYNDTPEDIIERADKALYKSKNSGKDQINTEKAPNGN